MVNYGGIISGAIEGYMTNLIARRNAELENWISEENERAQNAVTNAGNNAEMAKGSLARFVQSVNNNNRLKQGGQQLEAAAVNQSRLMDRNTTSNFNQSMGMVAQAGAQAAAAGAAGVSGAAPDEVASATRLRAALIRQTTTTQQGQQLSDDQMQRMSMASQMVGGLNSSVVVDSLNYQRAYQRKQYVRGHQNAIALGILGNMGWSGGADMSGQDWAKSNNRQGAKTGGYQPTQQGSGSLGEGANDNVSDRLAADADGRAGTYERNSLAEHYSANKSDSGFGYGTAGDYTNTRGFSFSYGSGSAGSMGSI